MKTKLLILQKLEGKDVLEKKKKQNTRIKNTKVGKSKERDNESFRKNLQKIEMKN